MRLIIVFIIIGATAIAIPGVGGALVNGEPRDFCGDRGCC